MSHQSGGENFWNNARALRNSSATTVTFFHILCKVQRQGISADEEWLTNK